MNIDEAVEKVRQILKLMWDLANDSGIGDIYSTAVTEEKKLNNTLPFAHLAIGDYDFYFNMADGFYVNYSPKEGMGKYHFDPKNRIESFTMKPKEKP